MKKFLAVMLVCSALLMFGACRNDDPAPVASPTPPPIATPAVVATPTPPPIVEEPAGILPWTGETITFRFFAMDTGVNEPFDAYGAQLLREMMGNVEIIWDTPTNADYATRLNLYWAGGGLPDVMWVNRGNSWDLGMAYSGMLLDFMPLLQYMPNFVAAAQDAPWAMRYVTTDGRLTNIPNLENDAIPEAWFANMEVLNRFDLEIPTTLQELEAAMEIIVANDPTIVPFQSYGWGLGFYVDTMSHVLGNQMPANRRFFDHVSGQWDHHILNAHGNSRYREVVELLRDWRERGFLHPEFMTLSGDEANIIMASGNWAFTSAWAEQISVWFNIGPREPWPMDIVWMPNPQPEAGVAPFANARSMGDNVWWGFVAREDVHHPEVLAAVIDLVYSYEISTAFQWGQEGVSFYYDANGEKQWIEAFLDLGPDARSELGIWNLMLPRYATLRDDTSMFRGLNPRAQEAIRGVTQMVNRGEILVRYPAFDPVLTDREREDASFIRSANNTIQDEWVTQIIAGIRPMSDFEVMRELILNTADLPRYMEIWNNAPQMPARPTAAERHFVYP